MNDRERIYRKEHESSRYLNSVKPRYTHPLATIYSTGLQDELIKHIGPTGRVLECGCGLGYLLFRLRSKGNSALGMDISLNALSMAGQRCSGGILALGNLERLAFRTESVDTVVVMGVLHHLKQPDRALAEMHRVLKPNGILVVEEPNHNLLIRLIRRILPRLIRTYADKPVQTDYTMGELRKMVETEGYVIEQSERYGFLTCLWSMPDIFPMDRIGGSGAMAVSMVRALSIVDRFIAGIPLLNRLCWQNILKCRRGVPRDFSTILENGL